MAITKVYASSSECILLTYFLPIFHKFQWFAQGIKILTKLLSKKSNNESTKKFFRKISTTSFSSAWLLRHYVETIQRIFNYMSTNIVSFYIPFHLLLLFSFQRTSWIFVCSASMMTRSVCIRLTRTRVMVNNVNREQFYELVPTIFLVFLVFLVFPVLTGSVYRKVLTVYEIVSR